jgi:hypothetical protein
VGVGGDGEGGGRRAQRGGDELSKSRAFEAGDVRGGEDDGAFGVENAGDAEADGGGFHPVPLYFTLRQRRADRRGELFDRRARIRRAAPGPEGAARAVERRELHRRPADVNADADSVAARVIHTLDFRAAAAARPRLRYPPCRYAAPMRMTAPSTHF